MGDECRAVSDAVEGQVDGLPGKCRQVELHRAHGIGADDLFADVRCDAGIVGEGEDDEGLRKGWDG